MAMPSGEGGNHPIWMGRTQKIEAEVDPHLVMPVREVS